MQKQQNIPGRAAPPVHLHRPPAPDLQGELLGNGHSLVGAPAIHHNQFITRGQGYAPEGSQEMGCSLRVGTITEMRGEGDGVTTELALAIVCISRATTQDLYGSENAQRSGREATACVHDGG